jgi:excisionase family DNA binding protein
MPEDHIQPLLNSKTAAQVLGLHSNTVLLLLRTGVLPGFRLGRYWRIRSTDLDIWLQKQTQHHAESTAYPELSSVTDESD